MSDPRTLTLIEDLRAAPAETSLAEFKANNADPEVIGRLISALANAARIVDQHFGYVLWGIRDEDHEVVGTTFDPTVVANALIHQDMTVTGAGPLIELFKDRLEITNPRVPLVKAERFIDAAPRSWNEALAALIRRMKICEERGTGIDKVITALELFQLPPPDFRVEEGATRVVIYGHRRFAAMTAEERVRACYHHSVLKFICGQRMRNNSLRERFGIEQKNAAQVSQVIRLALNKGLIRPADPDKPQAAYIPFWA